MARKWSNLNIPGALHFVTGNVLNRIPIFTHEQCCREFFRVCCELRNSWPTKLIAHVLMPDHFHLIANPRDGDIQGFIGTLKGKLSMHIIELTGDRFLLPKPRADGSTHQMWQESFKAVPLWSAWMIWQKINYIHANPVKAKLVTSAKDYQWSSFQAFYSGSEQPLAADQEWWWADDSEKLSKAMKELGWRTYHKRSSDKKEG
jgi:REP element-mobilizing transposase RayT